MDFPADLPDILEYKLGDVLIRALPRTPIRFQGSGGRTNCTDVCQRIPHGAAGWRLMSEATWRPMATLPPHWMPFLNRKRPSQMDPRPEVKLTKEVG